MCVWWQGPKMCRLVNNQQNKWRGTGKIYELVLYLWVRGNTDELDDRKLSVYEHKFLTLLARILFHVPVITQLKSTWGVYFHAGEFWGLVVLYILPCLPVVCLKIHINTTWYSEVNMNKFYSLSAVIINTLSYSKHIM